MYLKSSSPRLTCHPGRQRGFLLIISVVLIVVAALALTVMVYFSVTGNQATVRHLSSKQALFVAESGLERGTRALLSPVLAERRTCAAVTGDVNLSNVAFGAGRFTVTGGVPFYPAAPTTLRLAISATDSTIPVNGLAGYAAAGRVLIGGETIDYSEVEAVDDATCGGAGRAPCLVGAARGRDGTMAATHAAGSPVGQYQCDLESRGGVPDFANARGKRVVNQGVQLQEGWAVSENGTFFRWDNMTWQNLGAPVATQFNSISMLSYAEGWAVGNAFNPPGPGGNQEAILFWNGTAWVLQPNAGAIPNTDLNSVYCVNSNNCWAVGDDSGGEVILHWTGGPNWTRMATSNAIDNTDLNAVHCFDAGNCWAVGDSIDPPGPVNQREVILQGNGVNWSQLVASAAVPNVDLNDVHCATANDCWAVGDAGGGGERPNLVQRNSGVWTLNNSGLNINQDMNAVFCVATDDCWAVGDSGTGAAQRPLILHWNGTVWTTRNSNLNINQDLSDVYCVTASDCWAVGDAGGGGQRPLLLHWDGNAWSVQNSGLNVNQDLVAVHVIGARRHPQAAWREVYQ